ncbi:MAG: sulfotransferase [Pseudomonadota bacterium]
MGPDFLCVGMPKCGTSTLHSVLDRYSDIYVSPFKEIKYFAAKRIGYEGGARALFFADHWAARQERKALVRISRRVLTGKKPARDLLWAANFAFAKRNLDWYKNLFPAGQVSGDLSPAYHSLSRAEIDAIAADFPDLKIVILLRNPYHQIWSHCRMSSRGKSPADRAAFFRSQIDYQLDLRRTYKSLVDDWSKAFGRDNVLVDYLENMKIDTQDVARRIISFVDPDPASHQQLQAFERDYRVFPGAQVNMPTDVHAMLLDAAQTRLDGFETIDPERADIWRTELADMKVKNTQDAEVRQA